MKIILDMNLSSGWCDYFSSVGVTAVHWVNIGSPSSTDKEIFEYAKDHGYCIFTHDLDFSVYSL